MFFLQDFPSAENPNRGTVARSHTTPRLQGENIFTVLINLIRGFGGAISVADPGCLSRILIFTHPGSRISDPGSQNSNKREGWKKFFVIPFYLATNFTKLNIILVLKSWRKKFGSIFKELYNILPKKLSLSSQTYGFGIRDPGSEIRDPRSGIWDPGSEIRDLEKTYSGSRIQGSKRHRIPDPQHWARYHSFCLFIISDLHWYPNLSIVAEA